MYLRASVAAWAAITADQLYWLFHGERAPIKFSYKKDIQVSLVSSHPTSPIVQEIVGFSGCSLALLHCNPLSSLAEAAGSLLCQVSGPLGDALDSLTGSSRGIGLFFLLTLQWLREGKGSFGGAEVDMSAGLFLPTALLFLSPKRVLLRSSCGRKRWLKGVSFPLVLSPNRFLFTP